MTQLDAGLSARCPRCAAVLPADARRCDRCGCDLVELMVELVSPGEVPASLARHRRFGTIGVLAVAVAVVGIAGVAVAAGRVVSGGCRPSAGGGVGSVPIVSECTRTVLVLDGTQVLAADLDHGIVKVLDDPHVLGSTRGAATTSPSDGYLAFVDAGHAWAVPVGSPRTGRARPDRDLGAAGEVLDDGGAGWWLVEGAGVHPLPGSVARRVRGDGRATGGPLILGDGVVPVLGVDDGLIVRNGVGAISVVGGSHPRPVRTGLDVRRVIAGRAHTLVVLDGHDDLWMLDVRTGRTRPLGSPGRIGRGVGAPGVGGAGVGGVGVGGPGVGGAGVGEVPGVGGPGVGGAGVGEVGVAEVPGVKFSPDGRWLAILTPLPARAEVPGSRVSLVEVSTGRVTAVPGGGTASEQPALAWSPDSRRVFFTQAGGPVGRTLGMFRRGGRGADELRLFPDPIDDMASVAGPG